MASAVMSRPLKPNDLLAVVLLWGLIVTGCMIGDVTPTHSQVAMGCPPEAPRQP
ncbi:MAG: hypothetical protein J0I28_02280 [Caulobacterales bacterium]|nr:hypothetical protein [Caulobacterales bacterium]